jgi:GTP-binding protein Era
MEAAGFKSGFVALIGRPNVGKSTLMNALLGTKVSIVSPVPQTTRYQLRGILNRPGAQIVFVDTPGIHSFRKELAAHLNEVAVKSTEGIEALLYVVDATRRPAEEEEKVMSFVAKAGLPVIMAVNKTDLDAPYVDAYMKMAPGPVVSEVRISAKTGRNLERLISELLAVLPEQPAFYPADSITDFPLNYRIADVIREKMYLQLKEELPHATAVEVPEILERGEVLYIRANIYVNRGSQKKIVIGRNGEMIKRIGTAARREIQAMVRRRVYVDLFVKVVGDWQEKPRILKELGYWWA